MNPNRNGDEKKKKKQNDRIFFVLQKQQAHNMVQHNSKYCI